MTPPRVVVFDLGGVVVRIARSWQEGCTAAGMPYHAHVEPLLHAVPVRTLLDQHQRGVVPCSAFFAGFAQLLQGAYTPQQLQAIHHAWTMDDYPGIQSVIEGLHAQGVPTACLSNTNASHWDNGLRRSAALARIQHQYASHQLGLAKPDPAIYAAFQERSGFPAQRIVFFDDLAENIAAARACGWDAVQIDHTGDTAQQVRRAVQERGVQL